LPPVNEVADWQSIITATDEAAAWRELRKLTVGNVEFGHISVGHMMGWMNVETEFTPNLRWGIDWNKHCNISRRNFLQDAAATPLTRVAGYNMNSDGNGGKFAYMVKWQHGYACRMMCGIPFPIMAKIILAIKWSKIVFSSNMQDRLSNTECVECK